MKRILLLTIISVISFKGTSQEVAPTLSLGLDQVLFTKGTLDVDLIAKMIAEKQDELKKRIVEKEILEPVFENSPFATRNYVFSVVKNLMNEKDKKVLKKELMEQTVNYTIVYVLAEMYVQLSWNELAKEQSDTSSYFSRLKIPDTIARFQNSRIQSIKRDFLNRAKLYQINSVKVNVNPSDTAGCCNIDFSDILIDMMFEAVLNDRVLRSKGFFNNALYFDLDYYRSVSNYHTLPANNFKFNMYRDVKKFVSDVAEWYEAFEELAEILENGHGERNQDVLKALECRLLEKIKEAEKTIDEVNQSRVKDEITALEQELQEKEGQTNDNKLLLRRLRESRTSSIDNLIRSLVLSGNNDRKATVIRIKEICEQDTTELNKSRFKEIVPDSVMTSEVLNIIAAINEINANIREIKKQTTKTKNGQDKISAAIASIKKAIELEEVTVEIVLNLMDDELQRIASDTAHNLSNEYDSLVMRLYKNFYFVKNNVEDAKNLAYLRWANEELLPEIAYLNLKSKGNMQNILRLTEALNALIETEIYKPILNHFSADDLISHQFSVLLNSGSDFHANYLKFFQRLDELGEMETYYYLLNEVLLAYESCKDQDVATAVKLILGSVEKYTSFDQENDRVDVDVESIILALAEKYGDRDKNPFNFYMTVGLNYVFAFKENSLIGEEGNSVSNFAFASEKIGIRVNLWNWQMRSKYSYGETRPILDKEYSNTKRYYKPDPIISNIHLLAYGSGLLYHLTDLGTEKNLNTTFIGTGLGVSFYNKLNFNTSLLFPVRTDEQFQFNTPFLNIGFDVLFIDYINELNKKRKAKKELKDLANEQYVHSASQL